VKSIYSLRYNRLRKLLVQERRNARLTQAQLSKRIGRPQSFISKVEMGERRLDVIELIDILSCLESEPLKFFRLLLRRGR
jgi:transcriptional regulator with XRE-family HTH domain